MNQFKVNKIDSRAKKLKNFLRKIKDKKAENKTAQNSTSLEENNLFSRIRKPPKVSIITKSGINLSIFISLAIIGLLCFAIIKILSGLNFNTVLIAAGENLQEDNNNHTNVLILGTGTKDHDGSDLTDTIISASYDHKKNILSMISIPRDLHIVDKEFNSTRINEIYFMANEKLQDSDLALKYLMKKTEEVTGVDYQYYVKINFDGFKEIIDVLGGIDVNIPNSIYDPFYPKGESTGYEIFSIQQGLQHLDGKTALKYARSRKTSSDFDRSNRQHEIIMSAKDKALQKAFDKNTLQNLLQAAQDNIETNFTVREIMSFGGLVGELPKERIYSKLLHDNPVDCGGFLYTPFLELYNGAFVLIPAGDVSYVHKYFDLISEDPEYLNENLKIQILNSTKKSGVAAEQKQVLQRYCMDVIRFGNGPTQDVLNTKIYYKMIPIPKKNPTDEIKFYKPATVDMLKKYFFPTAIESTEIPQVYQNLGYTQTTDIIIEIGSDYTNSASYMEDPFYELYDKIYDPKATAAAATTTPATTPTPTN